MYEETKYLAIRILQYTKETKYLSVRILQCTKETKHNTVMLQIYSKIACLAPSRFFLLLNRRLFFNYSSWNTPQFNCCLWLSLPSSSLYLYHFFLYLEKDTSISSIYSMLDRDSTSKNFVPWLFLGSPPFCTAVVSSSFYLFCFSKEVPLWRIIIPADIAWEAKLLVHSSHVPRLIATNQVRGDQLTWV